MTQKNKHLIKFTLPLALGVVLSLAAGCGKPEKTEADHAEMKMPDAQSIPTSIPATSPGVKTSVQPQKYAELVPLPAEVLALVASNHTASVQEQVYYITNSTFTDVQKAQTLIMILPSFNSRDDQRAVAHAAVAYLSDSTHKLIDQPLLEGKLHPQLLSIFMTDTLKRSDAIKIPILTSIAATKDHPFQAEAQDLLVAFSKSPAVQQQASNKTD
jgi:hypothetical protein